MSDARLRPDEAASESVDSIHFSFYSAKEARKISVKAITKAEVLDVKNCPVQDGLYDPALGPIRDIDTCKSCGQQGLHCPGHYGHIDLTRPLFNPLLFVNLKKLLQITCFYCHKFRMGQEKVLKYVSIMKLVIEGNIVAAKKLATNIWDEAVFGSEHIISHSNVDYCKGSWTSIQQTEATSVLGELMRERPNRCEYCNKINPKLKCHTFGWLEKISTSSQIKQNFIQDSSLGLSFAAGKKPNIDSNEDYVNNNEGHQSMSLECVSEGDGDLLEAAKILKGTSRSKELPLEVIKQLTSFGKADLPPSEVEAILKNLWTNESELCMFICDIQCKTLSVFERKEGYAMFFLKALLVPPNKFRPSAQTILGVLEHPQNVLLSKVVEANIALGKAYESHQAILRKWRSLQNSVNLLFDSTKGFGRNDKIPNGIRQLLDKKDGMLRQKMMGKRVNFACRSVISPDPYLAANEIGIPPYFALRLTYPERVTPWNVNKLRKVIMNGANCYPGATHYRDRERFYQLKSEKDMLNAISRKLPTSRTAIKVGKDPEIMFEGKFVYRHLQDGDVVLVNRQPTLHKPGMMAHIVRVLHGEKTIRMHYANCSTYNADFDGDEMNVHFPQDEISRAESIHIVNANKQYIVPTSGDPIRGLIQDHIVSAVLLTKMDTFLTREEYNHLLYASYVPSAAYGSHSINFGQKVSVLVSVDEVQPLPPSIWKPKQLWTGKQVITAILHHLTKGQSPLNVKKEGRIPKEYFGNDATERQLFVYNNELVHGIIDKAQFGKYGLVHTVHEFYGADIAGRLLAVFSRLFTLFLQMHGFTCGVDDLLIFQKSDKKRRRILKKSEVHSEDVHSRFTSATSDFEDPLKLLKETEKVIRRNGESATTRLDRMMSNALNALTTEVNKVLFPDGLQKPFPNNCLSLMTATGAKGGLVNMTQISSLLGQQELEGKRVPRMASGKTLPCFPAWDISSRAGGFIADRFLTGLRPQEYYFHCMAGREGLVDTAVKTSRSGYLQRCLVKNLESLKVGYDHTVRDADGSIIQFTYGEDGVDVQKSSFLGEFEILSMNQKALLDKLKDQLGYACLSKSNGYVKELPDEIKEKATHFFSLLSKNLNLRGSFKPIKVKKMMKLVKLKYLLSLAEPGEAVGVLAAQSVGEPSTQMTLNTFHLAGRGEMNVTLGIPRLMEILISAKVEISTPVMTCPLLSWRTREDADIIAAKLGRICLADVIERMEVCTVPFYASRKSVFTVYKLILKLYSPELYPPHSGITLEECMNILQTVFLKEMVSDITKYLVSLSKISDIKTSTGKKDDELIEGGSDESESKLEAGNMDDGDVVNEADSDFDGGNDDGDDDDNDGVECEDLGGDAEKRKRQVTDEMDYDDDTENENDGMQTGSEAEEDDNEAGGQPPSSSPFEEEASSQSPVKEGRSEVKEKPASKKHISKCDRILLTKLNGLEFEVHFRFHQHEPHVLLAELAQKTAKRVFIKACSNLKHCSVVEPKRLGDPILLQTAGVNFGVLQDLHEYIDINKIVTNNIHEMLKTYGVEAARATIINEVKGVFDAYGIRVNIRHLMLIADLMTCNGEYRALNRAGMRRFSTSPFSKMSFETATNTIMEAAFHGEVDNMESPSACISLGKVVKLGTGGFDLLQNVQL